MKPSSVPKRSARLVALLLLSLVLLAFAPRTALAQDIIRGEVVAEGEVVENDVIMSGDEVRLAGTVKGNAFIIGRDVTVDGHVEGSLFTIAQRITINGTVDDSVYLLGLTAQLGSEASVGQNLNFVGVSLTTARGSQIGRDLNGLSLGAFLQGSVGRNTRLIAGLVQFLNLFMEGTLGPTPEALDVTRLGRAPGLGQFILPGNVVFDLIGRNDWPTQTEQPAETQGDLVLAWLLARLREFLPLLIVGLILYWFRRGQLKDASLAIRRRPLPTLGMGLVGLILAWATVAAFILVFILILMIGIWVGQATFWNVTWLLWSVAFPFAALCFALLLAFLNYGTKTIAMFAAVTALFDRFAPRAGRFRLLLLILGLVVYVLLRAIPTLGWVISILVTAWGIGGAWAAWRAGRLPAAPVVAPAAVAPITAEPAGDLPNEEKPQISGQ